MYLGQACQLTYEFEQAIRHYKAYLGKMKMKDPYRESIKDDIKRCVVGRKLLYNDPLGDVENISEINTTAEEFAPLSPPINENKLYFSTQRRTNIGGLRNAGGYKDTLAGEPRADIYESDMERGLWENHRPVEVKYNSRRHDILYGFTKKGDAMYVFRNENFEDGDLYTALIDDSEEIASYQRVPAPLNSSSWDGNHHFFNDTIVVFSSKRSGGYGGKDLYISEYNSEQMAWSTPENLGPEINTAFDEDTPFLCKDGRSLYFSSNNLKSIGGLDIFYSVFKDSSAVWTSPKNLGMPINSAGDERYFKITQNALGAYFSSERIGGQGGEDLYVATFRRYFTEMLQYSTPLVFSHVILEEPEPEIIPEPVVEEVVVEEVVAEETPPVNVEDPEVIPVALDTPVVPDEPLVEKVEAEVEYYQFSPINYKPNDSSMSPSATVTMRKLTDLLKKYPSLKVLFIAHASDKGDFFGELYLSAKQAGDLAGYLIREGIEAENIFVKACGGIYPRAKNKNEDGSNNLMGQVLNRRIEIQVFNTEGTPVVIEESESIVSSILKAQDADRFREKSKGLTYKVEVQRSKQRFEEEVMIRYPDGTIEANPASLYISSTVSLKKDYNTIKSIALQLRENGHKDAHVVAYINGIRITRKQAEALKTAYPDLNAYLNGEKK